MRAGRCRGAVFTKVTVSSTSGPGATDERQNFANWYSYYRKRMLTMKTTVGLCFSGRLTTVPCGIYGNQLYRNGYREFKFLNIGDFTSTQRPVGIPNCTHQLRVEGRHYVHPPTKVGRIYAGKSVPIPYSIPANRISLSSPPMDFGIRVLDRMGWECRRQQDGAGTPRPPI